MQIIKEFKEFAVKGNVMDLAVGVVIGGAFGKIVASLVSDLIMPPIGVLIGGVNFTDLKIVLKDAVIDASNRVIPPVTLNIGNFLQAVVDFTIIAFAIFLLVKGANAIRRRAEAAEPAPTTPETPAEIKLLTEIRDLLKK